jgi:UPF0042 nucleotide-binding protein
MLELLIVTGKSGSGKSLTIDALEDIGYYCIDNLPPQLISKVADLCILNEESFNKLAVVTDMRGGVLFSDLFSCLDELDNKHKTNKILFIKSSDSSNIRRYIQSTTKHTLSEEYNLPIPDLVKMESEKLDPVLQKADYIVDTTYLRNAQLKERISELFTDDKHTGHLNIHCMSFGFKYGTPAEADLLFDVRCFPNPFYVEKLRHLTGLDKEIQDFVLESGEMKEFLNKLFDMLDFLIPLYIKEGKSQLVIGIGCTGGKHRSVVSAQLLFEHLSKMKYHVSVNHRDISK